MNGVSAPAPELPVEDEVDEVVDDVHARGQLLHGQGSRRRPMSNQGNVKVSQQTPIMMCFGKSYIAQAALVGFWSAVAVAFLARAFLRKAEKQRQADATAFGTTFVVVTVTTFALLQRQRDNLQHQHPKLQSQAANLQCQHVNVAIYFHGPLYNNL